MTHSITALRVTEHRGCKVYVRHIEGTQIFEYLAIIKGLLYTAHSVITKRPLQALLGRPYTEKQLGEIVALQVKLAETTIDIVLGDEGEKSP